ncbi:hypothetical protein WM41_0768 [Corynebacterium simulans]|uniref:Uncharacterized protein n=1 Tax=Corynebacterium simulans TaxID=146827 RepID=A0ABR5VAW5_9CORY|nr:hypothetical protein WM41_0768 [Corynebacterium simulans]
MANHISSDSNSDNVTEVVATSPTAKEVSPDPPTLGEFCTKISWSKGTRVP